MMLIITAVLGLILCFFGFGDNSEGVRAGEIIKYSYKGWVWQTYEGELSMNTITSKGDSFGSYVFQFSICDKDPEKIKNVEENVGKKVKLTYYSPIFYYRWNQKSSHCIKSIQLLEE